MASRGKRRLDARVAAFGGPTPARAQAFPAPLRVLILSALLLLAVYTAFSAYRLKQSATGDRPAGPNLAADASLLVGGALEPLGGQVQGGGQPGRGGVGARDQ